MPDRMEQKKRNRGCYLPQSGIVEIKKYLSIYIPTLLTRLEASEKYLIKEWE
jgi:hypothetical protein